MGMPAFTEIYDVPRTPISLINLADLMKDQERIQMLWERIKPAMDARTQEDPRPFFASIASGQTILYDICDGKGLLWIYQVDRGNAASLSLAIWGSLAELRQHGDVEQAAKRVVRTLMKAFELRKIRAFVPAKNRKAVRLADRMMTKEGHLVDEIAEGEDLLIYGALRGRV